MIVRLGMAGGAGRRPLPMRDDEIGSLAARQIGNLGALGRFSPQLHLAASGEQGRNSIPASRRARRPAARIARDGQKKILALP
jgi:hypothetical protein